ncbi:MAG: metallophosphoesterase family protein [Myxococcota bacterium]
MKLAHFSDIHITHFPLSGGFALKRLAAIASYTLMGRGAHFTDSDQRIARLLEDVDAQGVDHALCTGDLTGVSTAAEFEKVAALFGPRLQQPARFTVIPGNHDRYVRGVEGHFERHFGALSEQGRYPFVKHVSDEVTIVAIDVARPTSVVDSSGLCGGAQREKLLAILTDASLRERFVVLALHYGLLRAEGQRDRRNHGLRDDLELLALVDRPDVSLDLVVHGHMHRPYVVRSKARTLINAGSATDLHVPGCGYHVYEIDPRAHRVRLFRRAWNQAAGRYDAAPDSPLNRELVTRG